MTRGTRCRASRRRGVAASRLEDRLDLDLDADLLGDDQAAVVERHVPGQAPVLAVDGPGGTEDGAMASPRVGDVAQVVDLQCDRPRDATDRELAASSRRCRASGPRERCWVETVTVPWE